MSTRSHVRVYKNNEELAAFYHHYDGYLEGVGNELVDIAKKELSGHKKRNFILKPVLGV